MVIYVQFEKELEGKLRENAMKRFGYAKGAIKEALEEAIELWLVSKSPPIQPQPLSALRGMLKDVRATSVELKHSAIKLFTQ